MLKFILNHKLCSILALLLVALALPAGAFGQVDQGSINGTVKDSSGGSIAGAQVTLTNQDTGVTQVINTNESGEYIFAPIKIGTYSLTAEFKGFQKVQQKNVSVDVQQKVLVDITLPAGAASETVIVNDAPPALQTQDASVGQVIEEREVKSLPLNGRNFTFLAQLSAGVTQDQADTRGLGSSGSFAAKRFRPPQNNDIPQRF